METTKADFEGEVIELGDEVVAFQAGLVARGKVIAIDVPGTFGCVVIQSLRERTRTMLVVAKHCVVVSKASQQQPQSLEPSSVKTGTALVSA